MLKAEGDRVVARILTIVQRASIRHKLGSRTREKEASRAEHGNAGDTVGIDWAVAAWHGWGDQI